MKRLKRPLDRFREVPESRMRWIFLAAVVVAASSIGLIAIGLSHQTARITQQVDANRRALVRLCSTGDVVKHLDGFFLGLVRKKPPPGETAAQKRVRVSFRNLIVKDLTTLAHSDRSCASLVR